MTPQKKAEEIKMFSKDPEITIHYIIRTLSELKSNPDFREVNTYLNTEINFWVKVLNLI